MDSNEPKGTLSGLEKTAILLNVLGKEKSLEFMKDLKDGDIKRLLKVMGSMRKAPITLINSVLREYLSKLSEREEIIFDENVAKPEEVTQALGEERAKHILGPLRPVEKVRRRNLSALESVDIETLTQFLKDEHPQTAALVVAHMDVDKQVQVLKGVASDFRTEIIVRMASLDQVESERVDELDEMLKRELLAGAGDGSLPPGGIKVVADLVNNLDGKTLTALMTQLEEKEPSLAEQIKAKMFTFVDLVKIDTKGLQSILREVSNDRLILALKSSPDELKEKICAAMSERAAMMLREDLGAMGPQRLSDVEAAQREVVTVVKKLQEEGKLRIGGGDEQELV